MHIDNDIIKLHINNRRNNNTSKFGPIQFRPSLHFHVLFFFFYSRNAITSRLSSRWNQHCRIQHRNQYVWSFRYIKL